MKNLQTIVQTKDLGDGAIEAVVADESIDRDGEQLLMKGLDVSSYKKNPVVQWAHDYSRPPIGKAEQITKKADGSLVAKVKFAITESNFAKEVYALYKGGFLNAFSIGFLPKEAEGNVYTKSEMLEFSAVPVPANANALVTAKAKGIASEETITMIEQKSEQTQKQTIEKSIPDELKRKFIAQLKKDPTDKIASAIRRLAEWAASGSYPKNTSYEDLKWMYNQCVNELKDRNPDSTAGGNFPAPGSGKSFEFEVVDKCKALIDLLAALAGRSVTHDLQVKVNTDQLEFATELLTKAAERLNKEVTEYKKLDRAGAAPHKKRVRLVRVKQAAGLAQTVSQSTCNLPELRKLKRRSIRRVHVKTK